MKTIATDEDKIRNAVLQTYVCEQLNAATTLAEYNAVVELQRALRDKSYLSEQQAGPGYS